MVCRGAWSFGRAHTARFLLESDGSLAMSSFCTMALKVESVVKLNEYSAEASEESATRAGRS